MSVTAYADDATFFLRDEQSLIELTFILKNGVTSYYIHVLVWIYTISTKTKQNETMFYYIYIYISIRRNKEGKEEGVGEEGAFDAY